MKTITHPLLAVTMGEPAGIGADISFASYLKLKQSGNNEKYSSENIRFFMIDSPERLKSRQKRLGYDFAIQKIDHPAETYQVFAKALPVLSLPNEIEDRPSELRNNTAELVLYAIRRAVDFCQSGEISGMITNPIHKSILQESGFSYPGHTEFLAALTQSPQPIMMLVSDTIDPPLRVIPLTIHIPLSEVSFNLAKLDGVSLIKTIVEELRQKLGIEHPRLALAGLNPHAGEQGHIGKEEIEIFQPWLERLNADHIQIKGPHAADSLFHPEARASYDAVLCPTHDQALIPLKTLDFYGGVNLTLGLPIIRCSPDHGTALSLAGSGRANPQSMIASLTLAHKLALNHANKSQ